MIVVSDTSPLTALLTVGQAQLLEQLFGTVIVPAAVGEELARSHAQFPSWLQIRSVSDLNKARLFAASVDRSEAEAIVLAQELKADHLLMDERKGRRLAREQGLPVLGLLGVVLLAKRRGLIASARTLLERLEREAGIYLSPALKEAALKAAGE